MKILVTARLFSFHSTKIFIFRSRCPVTVVPNTLKNSRRHYAHSTIDSKDIFQVASDKLLDTYWDPHGIFKPVISWNYLRLPYVRDGLVDIAPGEKISTSLKGKKILEVGCGAGALAEGLAKYGAEVTGIDSNGRLIKLAQDHSSKNKRLANNQPTYILSTVEDHCISNSNKYDAIVASEVIEHITEKELFVESCVRATKPGGKLFFTTPNRTLFAQIVMIYLYENVLRCVVRGGHKYDSLMKPDELQFMLEMNDCIVEDIRGYMYYPWDNWAWTNHKLFSFAMQAVKLPIKDNI